MEIEEKIKAIVSEQLEIAADTLTEKTTFEEIDADSLDIVELVMALEEEFDLEITDHEIEEINTLGDIINFIESKV